jgi:hypothetical protein
MPVHRMVRDRDWELEVVASAGEGFPSAGAGVVDPEQAARMAPQKTPTAARRMLVPMPRTVR